MDSKLLNLLKSKAKRLMEVEKLYHDYAHANNVLKNAEILVKKLGGDEIVIYTSALFHDISRDQESHDEIGALKLRNILFKTETFPAEKVTETCLAVKHHERGQVNLNEKILADADKMDAFNELGIARSLMIQSKQGFSLKDSATIYLNQLEKWYSEFNFDYTRELIKENHMNAKNFLNKIIKMYEY